MYICFLFLLLLAARAILDIVYTVLIHSISGYSHCLARLLYIYISKIKSTKVNIVLIKVDII
ncbi:hypothetical protein CABS01_16367 [Colletotrichum abscissum]|uniref:uncharacterized protein n=1 Tax=Colletotrichum abscissum TaxID=1671311 RepID=UPI0027D49F2A|nr:uncharacterized protein CABS01_16367 [Colletotrichum abscissum]KAK1471376.1 hypothetical protein CABS01_16367 [Colletotrichum abscissum]